MSAHQASLIVGQVRAQPAGNASVDTKLVHKVADEDVRCGLWYHKPWRPLLASHCLSCVKLQIEISNTVNFWLFWFLHGTLHLFDICYWQDVHRRLGYSQVDFDVFIVQDLHIAPMGGEIWPGGVVLYCFTVAAFVFFFGGGRRRMAASSVSNKHFQQPSVLYSAARYCVSDVRWCCSTSKTPHSTGCTQVILQSGGWHSTTVDITAFD